MRMRSLWLGSLLAMAALVAATRDASAQSSREAMRTVRGGSFVPLYREPGVDRVTVRDFRLDVAPVTNAEFLAFVREHASWRRSQVARLFADDAYLSQWRGDLDLGTEVSRDQPVTRVSWFAASAYCEARGTRLPTEAEWEYAARATETEPDGSHDAAFVARILAWYSQPQPATLPEVRGRAPNVWGIYDLHGLVWEWVLDFNRPRATADSRQTGDTATRFCGGAAVNATTMTDYAAFMRYAFRSSLRASYTVRNLGFRCAADVE